jgi:hypothetical protein
MAPVGQESAASCSQVTFGTFAFLAKAFPSLSPKQAGQTEAQAPHPIHASLSTVILTIIRDI